MEQIQETINNTDQDIVLKIEKLIEEISMLQVERQNLKKEYEEKNEIWDEWYEKNGKEIKRVKKKYKVYQRRFCNWPFKFVLMLIMSSLVTVICNLLSLAYLSFGIAVGINFICYFVPDLILDKWKKTELKKLESFDRDAYEELIELEELLSHSKRKLNTKKKKLSKALEMLNQKCIIESFQQNQIEQQMVEYYDDMYDAYSFKDVKMNDQNSEMDLQKEPYTKSSNHNLV